ncbi:MAG: Na+/H+ antiporter NhaD/arsenite permease-like protein [Chlamydiales bacterium]|jgi:Na+/H+ antiporter NhaD/arsenite permease-like protein
MRNPTLFSLALYLSKYKGTLALVFLLFCATSGSLEASPSDVSPENFPRPVEEYNDAHFTDITKILKNRVEKEPFNLVSAIIFVLAITHTLCANMIKKLSKRMEERHNEKLAEKFINGEENLEHDAPLISFSAEITYFLGEVEVIFGIWVIPLTVAIFTFFDWDTAVSYLNNTSFTEPMFVIVIMTLAETRPILQLVESSLRIVARLGKNTAAAWWFTLLTITPLLGSLITEPAAMTIASFLLLKQFYKYKPSTTFAYATLGLLFVNISVGGVLTNFAAPPVLMVARAWGWGSMFMLTNFGWKSVIGIFTSTLLYFWIFHKEFAGLEKVKIEIEEEKDIERKTPIPIGITIIHVLLLLWVVINAHHPVIFIGSFFLFIGFHQATRPHQANIQLKNPLLVGFFLAGLMIHGGLQKWWISPTLSMLGEESLMGAAIVLTAVNDNAIITYLATLVPDFSDTLKYAVVAGAVTGGGLTVIANAPNPVGQLVLRGSFGGSISPGGLLLGALIPTLIMAAAFLLL